MDKIDHTPNLSIEEYRKRRKKYKKSERRAKIRAARLKAVIQVVWPMFKHIDSYEELTGKRIKIIEEEIE